LSGVNSPNITNVNQRTPSLIDSPLNQTITAQSSGKSAEKASDYY
jgi:hypothetical protein